MIDGRLVIATAGYTKSGKTVVAELFSTYAGFEVIEMSEGVRSEISDASLEPSVTTILSRISAIRQRRGADALARAAWEVARQRAAQLLVIAGLRSASDLRFLRRAFPRLKVVYTHVTTSLRHQYMRDDPHSIAKTDSDFFSIDAHALVEGLAEVARLADYIVIDEPGFPLTPLEQVAGIVAQLAQANPPDQIQWDGRPASISSHVDGFSLRRPDHCAICSVGPQVMGGRPTARGWTDLSAFRTLGGHFHERAEEHIVVLSGTLVCRVRRAYLEEEVPEVVERDAGEALVIRPGWSHSFSPRSPVEAFAHGRGELSRDLLADLFADHTEPATR